MGGVLGSKFTNKLNYKEFLYEFLDKKFIEYFT
jgi:hypothetical protein